MKYIILLIVVIQISCIPLKAQLHSSFNTDYIFCTVLLEKRINSTFVPHGTGFLILDYSEKYSHYLVTCEHVLKNSEIYLSIPATTEIIEKLNSLGRNSVLIGDNIWILDGNILRIGVKLHLNKTYVKHDSLDIGVIGVSIGSWLIDNDTIKMSNVLGIPRSLISRKKDVPLGIDVYFSGFPYMIGTTFGLLNTKKYSSHIPTPLIRKGILAWKDSDSNEFLLDAFSYSGNSGSPVFIQADLYNKPMLIGMVFGHLPSMATDNMGLARCVWINDILDTIKKFQELDPHQAQ